MLLTTITNRKLVLLSTLALPLLIAGLLFDPSYVRVLAAISLSTAALLVNHPHVIITLFLLLRSSIDVTADIEIYGSLNLASIATLLFIFFTLLTLAKKATLSAIFLDRFLRRFNQIFFLFLFLCGLSLANSKDFVLSTGDIFRLLSILLVFNYSYIHFSDKDQTHFLLILLVLSSLSPLVLGFVQYILETGNLDTPGFNRIYGTFLHPNVFAQYLLIVFIIALYLLFKPQTRRYVQVAIALFLILVLFEIYQTFTRSVWIALILSIIASSVSFKKLSSKTLLYLVVGLVIFLAYENIRGRFLDIIYPDIVPMNSLRWRLITWNAGIFAISEHPFIGHGLGMYEQDFLFMAHNDFLRFAYEIGLPGFLCYLLLLGYLISNVVREQQSPPSLRPSREGIACGCLLFSLLLLSSADNLARSNVIVFYMFAVLGALLGGIKKVSRM